MAGTQQHRAATLLVLAEPLFGAQQPFLDRVKTKFRSVSRAPILLLLCACSAAATFATHVNILKLVDVCVWSRYRCDPPYIIRSPCVGLIRHDDPSPKPTPFPNFSIALLVLHIMCEDHQDHHHRVHMPGLLSFLLPPTPCTANKEIPECLACSCAREGRGGGTRSLHPRFVAGGSQRTTPGSVSIRSRSRPYMRRKRENRMDYHFLFFLTFAIRHQPLYPKRQKSLLGHTSITAATTREQKCAMAMQSTSRDNMHDVCMADMQASVVVESVV